MNDERDQDFLRADHQRLTHGFRLVNVLVVDI